MKKINKFIAGLCLFLTGCKTTNKADCELDTLTTKVRSDANQTITNLGYIHFGTGGRYSYDIHALDESYISLTDRFTSIEDARIFIVEKVQNYSSAINRCKEARPYLHHYPFGAESLGLGFSFYDSENRNQLLAPPYLARIWAGMGYIYYYQQGIDGVRKQVYQETYEKALETYINQTQQKNQQ